MKIACRAGVLAGLAWLGGCAAMPIPVDNAELSSAAAARPAKKRFEPELVEAVVIGAVRYEVIASGRAIGLDQDGGILRAIDRASGAELWRLTVYKVKFDAAIEADKQEIYITRLAPAGDGHRLLVEAEGGKRYSVDVQRREVIAESPR